MKATYRKLQNLIKNTNYSVNDLYFSLLAFESKHKLGKIILFNKSHKKHIKHDILKQLDAFITSENLEPALTFLLERYSNKKKTGTYYTPSDVSSFMSKYIKSKYKKNNTIMDPTSGTGSLLMSVIKELDGCIDKSTIYKYVFASDIDSFALEILKQRLLILFLSFGCDGEEINKYLKKNVVIRDITKDTYPKVDFIISNPPYFETKISELGYGNIYAKSLEVFERIITKNGSMSVIVPISFQTTKRMYKIREHFLNKFQEIHITSFADRPDSLFKGVHQKINIINVSRKGDGFFTTKYHIWRTENRNQLFESMEYFKTDDITRMIGDNIHNSIIKKITSITENILQFKQGKHKTFIASRMAQWSKAFVNPQQNGEYITYKFLSRKESVNAAAIFSSNIFWLLWVTISDGWHNSKKIIESLKITESILYSNELFKFSSKLLKSLEKNKVFVNTSQIEYVYKHKLSVREIEKIDKLIGGMLGLTKTEIKYINNIKKGVK